LAEYFDHQTAEQAAAWVRVQAAMDSYTAAHAVGITRLDPSFEGREFEGLYDEMYAFRYNIAHGFAPDALKAQQAYEKREAELNEAYRKAIASPCLVQAGYKSGEALRVEQRAWLKLREAWVDFLGTVFPAYSVAERTNMFEGGRIFKLESLTRVCEPVK
jgi:hypothetical protein